jgi:hypothetical protein
MLSGAHIADQTAADRFSERRHVAKVEVLDADGSPHITGARSQPTVPGRYFSITVPNRGRIALVAYDKSGSPVARVGTLAEPDHAPTSRDDARALGDPAGFAPAVAMPSTFSFEGGNDLAQRGRRPAPALRAG